MQCSLTRSIFSFAFKEKRSLKNNNFNNKPVEEVSIVERFLLVVDNNVDRPTGTCITLDESSSLVLSHPHPQPQRPDPELLGLLDDDDEE